MEKFQRLCLQFFIISASIYCVSSIQCLECSGNSCTKPKVSPSKNARCFIGFGDFTRESFVPHKQTIKSEADCDWEWFGEQLRVEGKFQYYRHFCCDISLCNAPENFEDKLMEALDIMSGASNSERETPGTTLSDGPPTTKPMTTISQRDDNANDGVIFPGQPTGRPEGTTTSNPNEASATAETTSSNYYDLFFLTEEKTTKKEEEVVKNNAAAKDDHESGSGSSTRKARIVLTMKTTPKKDTSTDRPSIVRSNNEGLISEQREDFDSEDNQKDAEQALSSNKSNGGNQHTVSTTMIYFLSAFSLLCYAYLNFV